MAQEEHATTPRALWLLVVAGPAIVAIEQQMNFVLVRQACSMQRNVALYVVTIVALLLTIATVMVGVSIWRRAGAAWPTEADDLANRIRFVAVLGILSSAMSFLVIVAQGIATIHFNPCQL
jgi:vacuolar-type H+-ATPase subunit I/STV1